jgi:hypothetical protein
MGNVTRRCRWAKMFLKGATLVMDEVEEGGCGEDMDGRNRPSLGGSKRGEKDHKEVVGNSWTTNPELCRLQSMIIRIGGIGKCVLVDGQGKIYTVPF